MENTRLHHLAQDFLDNKLDATGLREFHALLEDAAQREALTDKLLELTGQPDMNLEFDPVLLPLMEKARAVDRPPVAPVRRMRYWSWAAAVGLLLLAGSIYRLTDRPGRTPSLRAEQNTPMPGRQGAKLTLADGSTVMLDSMHNGVVASQAGTNIVLKNGEVTYAPEENGAAGGTYNTIATPRGRQFRIVLPDGTKVWLNAASSLRYPVAFTGNTRSVQITGEAYFEVTADASKPFLVNFSKNGVVEVLGTTFNINAYPDEPLMKTTLLSGSIRVNRQQVLQPGEQASMNDNGGLTVDRGIDAEDAIAWKNGMFMMRGTDLPALFRQISRWYDIEVELRGSLPDRSFGGTIGRSVNLADMIEALKIYGVNCKLENGKLIVQP